MHAPLTMGTLVSGQWRYEGFPTDEQGRFVRAPMAFRDRVTADGSTGHPAVAGRYHLYVSLACPWAHRTLIARKLQGLEEAIPVTVVDPYMGPEGWAFSDDPDPIHSARFLREVYTAARSDFTGRVTVPVLWDREKATIVNNESREILRMLDVEFAAVGERRMDLCPAELREAIDATIDANYGPINNGVYQAGFAETQAAHEGAVGELFAALDRNEAILAEQRFLCGNRLTEADICLFTTLLRFDPVYVTHFKCNVRRIVDYPNLWGFTRDVFQTPGVAETCNLTHIKQHYFRSHEKLNPRGIVPMGPAIDYREPHDRDRRFS